MWYADDSSKEGKLENVHAWFEKLKVLGPGYGYFPEPNKSIIVVAEADVENAKAVFGEGGPKITTNQRLLGGHTGSCNGSTRLQQGGYVGSSSP